MTIIGVHIGGEERKIMREDDGTKWLPAAKLLGLLATLPPDSRVMTNAVGNLLVRDAADEQTIAYIDFCCDGSVELMT